MPRLRYLLLVPIFVISLFAGAAHAATYEADSFVFLQGAASGTDGDGWTSASKFGTEIDQIIPNIHTEAGATSFEAQAPGNRVFDTTLSQDYSLVTVLKTITWSCAPDGQAHINPGSVRVTKTGPDTGEATIFAGGQVAQSRNCTGFSSFTGDIDISVDSLSDTWTFPWSDLQKGAVSHTIDKTVACGEWTIYQTACNLHFAGSVAIRRTDAPDDGETDPDADAPEPTPTPWTGDPDVSSPPRPATPIKPKVKGSLTKGNKAAKVKVTCSGACSGKISATAVATSRLKAKSVGTKSFSSQGGTKTYKLNFNKSSSKAIDKRGSVMLNVTSGTSTSSYRINAR